MTTKVIFYLLNQRFVENDKQVPEQAQQVMYYSLAIGHHFCSSNSSNEA